MIGLDTYSQVSKNILENAQEAITVLDLQTKVVFWNKGAELLFGYTRAEVSGRLLPFVSRDATYELQVALEKAKAQGQFLFKTQKQNKLGTQLELLVNVSPIEEENIIVGYSLIFQELANIKKATFVPYNLQPFLRDAKRTFVQIREKLLITLSSGRMTINQIALSAEINWRTVEKHLTFLIGKRMVSEVFSSEYVRIFELTREGKEYVEELKAREFFKLVK